MRRHKAWQGAVSAVALTGVLAGCAGGGASGDSGGTTKLTVSTFGSFGYGPLIKKYEKEHPNINVVLRKQEMAAHHEQLAKHLAAGGGTADIEAIEVAYMTQFKAQPQNFYNLLEFGAGELEDREMAWNWQRGMAPQGNYLVGLGTDVGGLAMCYRRDLFKKAGLPTDRDKVSKLWPTWEGYIKAGKTFKAAGTEAKWVDAGTNIFNPVLRQQEHNFFNRQGELLMGPSSGVKKAWDITMKIVKNDLSADLTTFQTEWATGFKKDAFATVVCPAWMMANIKQNAPKAKGKWDIAEMPGPGGNWGGSYLTIPKQTPEDEAKKAYELIKWLTQPEQELAIFKNIGNLPSTPELYDDPALTSYRDPYFNNAPVGKIFTSSAQEFKPQYLAPGTGDVQTAVENVIRQAASGNLDPDKAWEQAVQKAKKEVS